MQTGGSKSSTARGPSSATRLRRSAPGAKARYVEHNRRVYAELRERGLLPPVGENLPAHDINEYLRSGGEDDPNRSDLAG